MGISSLGAGGGVLTQDVIDKLKKADESQFVAPKEKRIKLEEEKSRALKVEDALMENVYQSFDKLIGYGLFDARTTTVTGSSVGVTANSSVEEQSFTLDVTQLATKRIEESGSFSDKTDKIADGEGSVTLSVNGEDFEISYDANTSLEDFKNSINEVAGEKVYAKVVQVDDGDIRLFINTVDTGASQDISISDNDDNLKGTELTDDLDSIQDGDDAKFDFDGASITRSSNTVDDLLSGVTITIKETGSSTVEIKQDRKNIADKINNFVEKYNAAMYQLDEDTKSSEKADERGVFSNDMTIKRMRSDLKNLFSGVANGVANAQDFGLKFDDNGNLSLDADLLNKKLDENPENVKAFFSGGTFTKSDGATVELEGAFLDMQNRTGRYTKYDATLKQLKDSMDNNITSLKEQKTLAEERLTQKYATMEKRFAAYDQVINQLNNASSFFTQLINSELANKK